VFEQCPLYARLRLFSASDTDAGGLSLGENVPAQGSQSAAWPQLAVSFWQSQENRTGAFLQAVGVQDIAQPARHK